MTRIAPDKWDQVVARIIDRHVGWAVTLRERPMGDRATSSILWRVPLRTLVLAGDDAGRQLWLSAGFEEPYIELAIAPLTSMEVELDEGGALVALHLTDDEATHYSLLLGEPD